MISLPWDEFITFWVWFQKRVLPAPNSTRAALASSHADATPKSPRCLGPAAQPGRHQVRTTGQLSRPQRPMAKFRQSSSGETPDSCFMQGRPPSPHDDPPAHVMTPPCTERGTSMDSQPARIMGNRKRELRPPHMGVLALSSSERDWGLERGTPVTVRPLGRSISNRTVS